MNVLLCSEARPLLEAYHDEELPVGDHIAVRAHLEWCVECAAVLAELRLLHSVVRARSEASLVEGDRAAFQAAVVSRARAEEHESWPVRLRELLDDMHVVYAGIGAAAATVFCVLVMLSMMRFATRERPDSLAAIVSLLASPKVTVEDVNAPGTNQNPVVMDAGMLMPRALDQLFLSAASSTDEVFTLSAVVTREGRLVNLEWHSASGRAPKAGSREAETVDTLLSTVSLARFEPARVAGLPVAVNMVWLVANTTVRGSKAGMEIPDGGVPAPRKRRVDFVVTRSPQRSAVA